jgi:hypothetical protein
LVVIGLTADQYALERDAALEGKRVSFLIGYRGKFVRTDGLFLPDGGYFWRPCDSGHRQTRLSQFCSTNTSA